MSPVEVTRCEGGVVRLRLSQPERANALSAELVEALLEAVAAAVDAGARVLVFSGAGRSFCGGFDLSGLGEESDASLAYRFLRIEELLQRVYYAPCYTVALAHGPVSGAGADLVASCSRRIAAPGTTFRFPGPRFGVVLGTRRLTELVGSRARGLVLEQRTVDAGEAAAMDLVDTVAPPEAWDGLVAGIAAGAVRVPPDTVRQVMELERAGADAEFGAIARAVAVPGLKARMEAYWHGLRAARSVQRTT